jgi:hypothetical protein
LKRVVPQTGLLAALVVGGLGCSPASIAPPSPVDAGLDAAVEAALDAPADAPVSFRSACNEYAYTRCTQIKSCSPTAILIEYGDVGTCELYYRTSCEIAAAAPSTGSTLAHVTGCTGEIATWKCSDIIYAENIPPDCQTPLGSLANGSPCAVNAQCQTAWCGHAIGAACGTCAPAPAPGDVCVQSSQCGSGLTCVASTGTCAVHAQLGAQCSATQPCDDGLTCAGGVCSAGASPAGATCDPLGAGCNLYAGLTCNAMSSTCQTIQIVPGGEACGEVGEQSQQCMAGTCSRGACVQGSALGAACDLTSPEPCLSFAVCVVTADGGTTGTCQIAGTTSCP